VCIARFRSDERARALLGLMGLSLVLYSGRPTFGPLIGLLPGSDGMFLHRYINGMHLSGLLLAGVGLAWAVRALAAAVHRRVQNAAPAVASAAVIVLVFAIFSPAWGERAAYAHLGGTWLREQRAFTAEEAPAFQALIEHAEANGPGRIYSGVSTNWGRWARLGYVPLYLVLLDADADAIGFTLHTTSISSDFEYEFDPSDPAHYELFGVRYLILPSGREPEVPATRLATRPGYVLWEIEGNGYLDVVDTVAPPIEADQVTLHDRAESFLTSELLRDDRYPTVAFAGRPAAEPTLENHASASGSAGSVRSERVDITAGEFVAEVVAERDAVVLLRSTFDPGWQVKVDGREVEPQMVAPSFVGAPVPPGRHTVAFRYRPFARYDVLFAIGVVTVFGLWAFSAFVVNPRARRRREADALGQYLRVPGVGLEPTRPSRDRRF
jgi:Bacterial membrane protein YfhO